MTEFKKEEATNQAQADRSSASESPASDTNTASSNPDHDYQKQIFELNDKLVRAVAESENIRRRYQQQLALSEQNAITNFAKDFVNLAEDLNRLVEHCPKAKLAGDEELKTFLSGLEMAFSESKKLLNKYAIERIFPEGEKFNHDLHLALNTEPSDQDPDTVLKVIQAGYQLKGRVLKEAVVTVAVAKDSK